MNVVPLPVKVCPLEGFYRLDPSTLISLSDPACQAAALRLQHQVQCQLGILLRLDQNEKVPSHSISLRLARNAEESQLLTNNAEAYRLQAAGDGVSIASNTCQGLLFGVQTLLQLLPVGADTSTAQPAYSLPAVYIEDAPRFPWRGLMLDTGRHYFSVAFIKHLLDVMLLYKFNRFHWHLCEDQGWRLEVQQYPRLAEFGAWRHVNGKRYGGYYTQQEVKEVVEYAAGLGITVVPEIEMPGHCVAALASYPELSCTGEVTEVSTHWGVHDDVYCAGREEVFGFLEGVLREVFTLFPSTYIHIGGDEVPKTRWSECPRCQHRISEEGLGGEEELQAWFLARINAFLKQHGRKLVGWDEILEGGLCEGATVMSWRGIAGGVAAARAGHDVVMTPTHGCYFDYRQASEGGEPGAWYAVLTLRQMAVRRAIRATAGEVRRSPCGALGAHPAACRLQVYEYDPVPPEPPASAAPAAHPASAHRIPSTDLMLVDQDGEKAEGGAVPAVTASLPVVAAAVLSGQDAEGPAALTEVERLERDDTAAGEQGGRRLPPAPAADQHGNQDSAEGGGDAASADSGSDSEVQWAHREELVRAGLTLTPQEAKHILGGQANLWTEYVATEEVAEYMVMPRACAMAEALWSPRDKKSWQGFKQRLKAHEQLWQRLGIQYRNLDP